MGKQRPANTVINKEYLFRTQYDYLGIGQIVGATYLDAVAKDRGIEKGKRPNGFAERYKVKLCWLNDEDTPENYLVYAFREGQYPSGQGGIKCCFPLAPNTLVNIHRRRVDDTYYITSVINNPIGVGIDPENITQKGCGPKSGYVAGLNWNRVGDTNINKNENRVVNENGAGTNQRVSKADKQQNQDRNEILTVPTACEDTLGGTPSSLKNFIQTVERIKKNKVISGISSTVSSVSNDIDDIQDEIDAFSFDVSAQINGFVGGPNGLRSRVMKKINSLVNAAMNLIFPNWRFVAKQAKDKALDSVACMFNNIMDNMHNYVAEYLKKIIDRYINIPLCVVDKFMKDIVGGLINKVLKGVKSILSAVGGVLESVIDVGSAMLEIFDDIIDFLTCKKQRICADVTEWNFLDGVKTDPKKKIDVARVYDGIREIAETFRPAEDGGIMETVEDAVNDVRDHVADFPNAVDNILDSCNVGALACGPPNVVFWGGEGSGGSGNAIISATGDILGVDIILPGNYTQTPFILFEDDCGKGSGATGTVVLDDDGGIDDVIITNPGDGDLPDEDGSSGGDGRVWADPDETVIHHDDGTWTHDEPGTVVDVDPGDTVTYPDGTEEVIDEPGTITTPPLVVDRPSGDDPRVGDGPRAGDGRYPIVIGIGDIIIDDPGFGHADDDTIDVVPDNGLEIDWTINNGHFTGIKVVKPGYGFTEYPEFRINTNSGYNAKFTPVFKKVQPSEVPGPDQIIQVVDCVGRV